MKVYSFLEIARHARKNSEYYSELYKEIDENEPDITKYPIIDQVKFWDANSLENNKVLTEKFEAGIIFKSGGTTGNPKFSCFTNSEWKAFTEISAKGYIQNGVKKGDRVGNLFYAGELYASFLYVSFISFFAETGINHPISGGAPIEEIVKIIKTLNINVLAGVPTTIMKIADFISKNKIEGIKIDLVLFGGESFYRDQRETLAEIFPGVTIHSILYASVDGGELGYADESCGIDEHRRFDETTIMEIVDEETGEPITDTEKPGKLLVTNLCRKLMPIIRYPAGDRAVWVDPVGVKDRKFRLLGRTEEGARIGPCTLYVQDAGKVLEAFSNHIKVLNFQIVTTHYDNKDQASLRILPLSKPKNPSELEEKIREKIYEERHMLEESAKNGITHPIEVRFIDESELFTNPRTGKAKRVVDNRFN